MSNWMSEALSEWMIDTQIDSRVLGWPLVAYRGLVEENIKSRVCWNIERVLQYPFLAPVLALYVNHPHQIALIQGIENATTPQYGSSSMVLLGLMMIFRVVTSSKGPSKIAGRTPLFVACCNGHAEVVRCLIQSLVNRFDGLNHQEPIVNITTGESYWIVRDIQ